MNRLKINQCLIVPESESADLVAMCAGNSGGTDARSVAQVAQQLADDEQESYAVVQVVKIVNPNRNKREES